MMSFGYLRVKGQHRLFVEAETRFCLFRPHDGYLDFNLNRSQQRQLQLPNFKRKLSEFMRHLPPPPPSRATLSIPPPPPPPSPPPPPPDANFPDAMGDQDYEDYEEKYPEPAPQFPSRRLRIWGFDKPKGERRKELMKRFCKYEGYITAHITTVKDPSMYQDFGVIVFDDPGYAMLAMWRYNYERPDDSEYLEYAFGSQQLEKLENPSSYRRHYPGVDLFLHLIANDTIEHRLEDLEDRMNIREDEVKRRLARSYLQMWDEAWEENGCESEYKMPGRILKKIFKAIDRNMGDIEDFREDFSAIQDLRPSEEDTTKKRRNRTIYLTAIANLYENLLHLSFLGNAMPELYPPLTDELQKCCDQLRPIRNSIVHILGSFLGPYKGCHDILDLMDDFDWLSDKYEAFVGPVFDGTRRVQQDLGKTKKQFRDSWRAEMEARMDRVRELEEGEILIEEHDTGSVEDGKNSGSVAMVVDNADDV
ncbi:uncharacterized protein PAC_13906 [Phialocephala subalpina]|uniref:Uncharacterized protein n=1 Tax=Phialocephala subalpina TaxID=576137 RepID=A0A1L7XG32_9HELO|nr:uncharacterized protein PAC_13906 [Phialocephala subalpina]